MANEFPRNRIIKHLRIRAGDLIPHEKNPRCHPESQRQALQAIYDEVGFARSLLAYQLPDGKLKIIDGHLRAELHPDQEVEVEVLDVNDAEARALLLTMDPLAQLASYDAQTLAELRETVEKESDAVREIWQLIEQDSAKLQQELTSAQREKQHPELEEKFLVLIECESEDQQSELLKRFQEEGLNCKALMS